MRQQIREAYLTDETIAVNNLLRQTHLSAETLENIRSKAMMLVEQALKSKHNNLDLLLHEYDLSSPEGINIMGLAEALLRIPDSATANKLIKDKLTASDWSKHRGHNQSLLVNAITWGLTVTPKILQVSGLKSVIRKIIHYIMELLGHKFVVATDIDMALQNDFKSAHISSYDMLGEAARTKVDALYYYNRYLDAIHAVGKINSKSSISIKLSALHPRFEQAKQRQLDLELYPQVLELALQAANYNIGLTIDAEEVNCLEITLDVFEKLLHEPRLAAWTGLGIAVQAYQKRALAVLDWLIENTRVAQRKINIRLVKGAYWDSEIKRAQILGLSEYPVYTRKSSTDLAYLACSRKLLANTDVVFPQFATHNAWSIAAIIELGEDLPFEFQCLYGLGQEIYTNLKSQYPDRYQVRYYAPVGSYQELLSYLVRRLLENGANTSFINKLYIPNVNIEELVLDPITITENLISDNAIRHNKIPLPEDIFMGERENSIGADITYVPTLELYFNSLSNRTLPTIKIKFNTLEQIDLAFQQAQTAQLSWDRMPVTSRANILRQIAELFEQNKLKLVHLLVLEAGKTVADSIPEVREAIDFCYYYAAQAEKIFDVRELTGPTGESNKYQLHGHGVIVALSPWNFPVSIFAGQILAALVAGNAVIAKPALQTIKIAELVVSLMHQAGIPKSVLHLIIGKNDPVGNYLVSHKLVSGVMLTGSTATAKLIQNKLSSRDYIVPFIAETGGQNCMIVDSSALPEQVITDVLQSAFGSAGQRCSALRVLYVQQDIADRIIEMLAGAMQELEVGDPRIPSTDIGPVIDQTAYDRLVQHLEFLQQHGKHIATTSVDFGQLNSRSYFAPIAYEINSIKQLTGENFGPILHVIRFNSGELDKIIDEINSTGFGLTVGVHTRIGSTADYITSRIKAGNHYVNRNMIGAVVGVQPFGGERLSGTGPKAGGPYYLARLAVERVVTTNTAAVGGDARLHNL